MMAKIKWKTEEEIEQEQNAPKPPTAQERIEAIEQALLLLMMEG